jgi:hypothetical protein
LTKKEQDRVRQRISNTAIKSQAKRFKKNEATVSICQLVDNRASQAEAMTLPQNPGKDNNLAQAVLTTRRKLLLLTAMPSAGAATPAK